jgi:hypothetical protein
MEQNKRVIYKIILDSILVYELESVVVTEGDEVHF